MSDSWSQSANRCQHSARNVSLPTWTSEMNAAFPGCSLLNGWLSTRMSGRYRVSAKNSFPSAREFPLYPDYFVVDEPFGIAKHRAVFPEEHGQVRGRILDLGDAVTVGRCLDLGNHTDHRTFLLTVPG